MPATDSELTSMEDLHALEDEEGSSTNAPSSVPPAVPSSTPPDPTTTSPSVPTETMIEKKAVSMASNDCSSARSSPAEASPAKPAATSPTTFAGSVETSPATSNIASASDSLTRTDTRHVNISESPLLPSALPATTFGGPALENDFPTVLTFKGVSVTLENNSVWKQFNRCGTEMILTKQGRRMFPYCRYRLAGLDPERQYNLVLSIVPSDQYRYRWSTSKWEVHGPAEHQAQGLIRAFSHHYSPCRGSEWMSCLVSFYKLKLTNCSQDHIDHVVLHSMHRYIPRLHVIPVPDGVVPTADQPVVMGPESMTFTFPQTEFMAVTTYQNFRITQLKINHNPFAKGFREDGNNTRLYRVTPTVQPAVNSGTQPPSLKPAEPSENKQEDQPRGTENITATASVSKEPETRLVLKPIMSSSSNKDGPHVPTSSVPKEQETRLFLMTIMPSSSNKAEPHVPVSPVSKEQETRLVLKPVMSSSSNKDEPSVPVSSVSKEQVTRLVLMPVMSSSSNKDEPSVPVSSVSKEQATRLVLKPIMSSSSNRDEPYVPCIRGKHALGELVLVQKRPRVEPEEDTDAVSISPKMPRGFKMTPKAISTSTPGSSPGYHKRRKRINRHWANARGREWKAAAASPTVVHNPSLTVAMQPELDDVEGLLFVSFTSKEALEVHVGDKPADSTPSASPVSLTTRELKEKAAVIPETDEEKIARLEAIVLQDLGVLKHRQAIHPVLQEVGLKLSSLDPANPIDLQYLGVNLPLPPPNIPEQDDAKTASPGDEGLSFISRTGKTSDMTKIKGWRNKFIKSKETSPSTCEGSQKNLSAFCSNMLDEYLESEAQKISERAEAFSTTCEGSVAYRLPAKSSSYVKTLDSVLKHRKAASEFPGGANNKPCPLSHKPLLYSALASPPAPLAAPPTPAPSAHPHTPPAAHRFSVYQPVVGQRPAGSYGYGQSTHRPGYTKIQLRLLQMEFGALNEGLGRTQLTSGRLSVALSVMLTKQMLPSQVLKSSHYPKYKTSGPECRRDFCTLGCVCSSLQHLNRGPLHCRRPDCMFGCTCFKRKITKQLSAGEAELPIQPVYSMSDMEKVQPGPGSHVNKLWNHNTQDVDPEPLYTPKQSRQWQVPLKIIKRPSVPRLMPPDRIREEDKDPVYKYLESMMTCARVREFNSKPPPELTIEPKIIDTSALNAAAKPQTADGLPKKYHRTIPMAKKSEKAPNKTTNDETGAKKQIQIQSACQWSKDRKLVLEALCRRLNQNRLTRRFWVGPYRIRPVAKIFMRKPSGSTVTYRVHISKPSEASDNDEEDYDDSDEEKPDTESLDGDLEAEEDENDEPVLRFGVLPFLSGVFPAGRLRARTKPAGCQAYGLIQVNGKSYNQARLLLGNMGSLHPANRLAAFVTGRLHPPGGVAVKNSQQSNPANKISTPGALHIKAAGSVVPPIITARKTTDLKAPTQPPVQLFQPPDSWRKLQQQNSQNSSTVAPFVSGRRSSAFQSGAAPSPVSLTVSQSLKTPSFLAQSGTYSFRICPPANQGSKGQNLPGVALPGGFTLIQLPPPGADGASSESAANVAAADKALPQKDALFNASHFAADSHVRWFSLEAALGVKGLPSSRPAEPGSSCEVPRDESDEINNRPLESDDLSSDDSDYSGDDDEEMVDIETIEEVRQGMAIAAMKEAVCKALKEARDSSDGFGSSREINVQEEVVNENDCEYNRRRKYHTAIERQRRTEQRILFDKLQTVLQSDPRAPRLRLLSLAVKEIHNLVQTSRCLEEKKRRLLQIQSVYVKELSLLSGKSDLLIKHKLNEICERQKVREKRMGWSPFFSNLLQSRAALLEATAPQLKFLPMPLIQPDSYMAASQANPAAPSQANPAAPSQANPAAPSQANPAAASQANPAAASQANPAAASQAKPTMSAAPSQANPPMSVAPSQAKPLIPAAPSQATPTMPAAPSPTNTPMSAAQKLKALLQPYTQKAAAQPSAKTPTPPSGSPAAQAEVTAPSLPDVPHQTKSEAQQEIPAAAAQASVPDSKTESFVAALLQAATAKDGGSPTSSTPTSGKPPVRPAKSFALPLIRSKTGRIILPSSLKPLGHGYYTLVVMEPKKKGKPGEVGSSGIVEPSGVGSSKTQDKSVSESDPPSDSESSHMVEEDKTVQPPNSKPKHSGVSEPRPDLAFLKKSIFKPKAAPPAAGSSQGGGAAAGVNKPLACLSFMPVEQIPKSAESDPSPPVVRRPRGRPRKHPVTPVSANGKPAALQDAGKSDGDASLPVGKTRREKRSSVATTARAGRLPEKDSPVPVKRGRGRPPKNRPAQQCGSPAVRTSKRSKEDSPVRLSYRFKSPKTKAEESPEPGDAGTSRPLTRGALGKDFPSAKKRSWIDVEKELEPELQSESESQSQSESESESESE